ncbi:EF-hand domain-containing protein [Nocardiopsis composta]|uniref:Ca2+-binding EF-hand superfamily protein n=1 Tax=Nocardiopsis composta TaxID=157465 RepID=A0A7W8QHR8_9ACTN|nr:EF-hand domain-containing protein [Nocardiopsis composta]MBB5429960.1 Ca2+-binding EF-hand superfamily protein [Nocardiopsis composta]
METVSAAAIAERFGRLFDTLDSDGDGAVDREDYRRLVDRYTQGYSLDADDRRTQALATSYQMLWLELLRHSPAPADHRLDRAAFIRAMHAVAEDGSRFNATEGLADAVFDLLDSDDSGSISEAEYLRYAEVLGAGADTARGRFKALDTDGDGSIGREEFIQSAREFLFGADTESAGGFVFGMV